MNVPAACILEPYNGCIKSVLFPAEAHYYITLEQCHVNYTLLTVHEFSFSVS
jgi:hypothetical protein